ncbi:hypothetical protein MKX33_02160 [Paenibacillus sp. FSL R5-0490]|uniref:hypothetical protein n=1 Tax=Paenibacillus sp. FSL R5-0490 TaxID=1920424 RepID=UPI0030CFFE52
MIRTFVQKDLKYVIEAHIRIYRNEYNYDHSFAEFITNAVNSFGLKGNHSREMLWIVELDQTASGSIGLTQVNENTAQLRWFLIEPEARGAGWAGSLSNRQFFLQKKRTTHL